MGKIRAIPEGFYLYRENFRFSKCEGWKRGLEYFFILRGFGPEFNGKLLTGVELYAILKEHWNPAALSDQDYYCYHMSEMASFPSPKEWAE